MLQFGNAPFLECSSRGDRRFSAFYARPRSLQGRSIEEAYQGMKVFDGATGFRWEDVKGKRADNMEECASAYRQWWEEWVLERRLLPVLYLATGLSDVFGQAGHVCQAEVLWSIRNHGFIYVHPRSSH